MPFKDENYTPFYAVEPLIKYLPSTPITIWCPFDKEWSAYVVRLKEAGHKVIHSHIDNGQDFFTYHPSEPYDMIISNPPFSKKDKILERVYALDKPFALLLPLVTLQGIKRYKYFKNGIQILSFDKRINFHNETHFDEPEKGSPFIPAYFCKDFLPKDLIFEELCVYSRPLLSSL